MSEELDNRHNKRVLEALLFASQDPLPLSKIREVTALESGELKTLLSELQEEYASQNRAFRLEEIGQGFLLRSCEELSPYLDALFRNKRKDRLSHAAAEVLAIIAYRQPITRAQIEAIRGVDSSNHVQNLQERGLVESVGKLEAPGRPTLFGVTNEFFKHFGLRDLKDLPEVFSKEEKAQIG